MSYTSQETAEHTGQPVELFFFAHGARAWRYTSASHDISPPASPPMDGLYLATAIKRSAIAQSTEKGRNTLTLDAAVVEWGSAYAQATLPLRVIPHRRRAA